MYLRERLSADMSRTLATLLIFSLSSGVLGGILFYIDSTGPYVLSEMSQNDPVHMKMEFTDYFYEQSQVGTQEILSAVQTQEGVQHAEHLLLIDGNHERLYRNEEFQRYVYMGVQNTYFDSFRESIILSEGAMPLNVNGCYLEKSIFAQTGASIGDSHKVTIVARQGGFLDVEFESRTFEIMGTFESRGLWGQYELNSGEKLPILKAILSFQGMKEKFSFLEEGYRVKLTDHIWTRFSGSFLRHSEPTQAELTLRSARYQIEQRTAPWAIVSEFAALGIVRSYSSWQSSMMAIAISFSIPTIFMGILLVYYSTKLLSDRLRRDVGMLRVRGASMRQALWWVISSTIVTGFLGAIGALVTGIAASLLSGSVRGFFIFDISGGTGFQLLLRLDSLAAVFLFSFALGFIVSTASTIRVLLMQPSKAHREIEQETSLEEDISNPIPEVIVAGISGVLSLQLLLLIGQGTFSGWYTPALLVVFFGAFIVSLTRLLSRATGWLKCKIMDRVNHPLLRVGSKIVGRNAAAKIRSEAIGVMFIAMVFTACTFSAIASTTGTKQIQQLKAFEIGGDIVAEARPRLSNVTVDFTNVLEDIEGVGRVSAMLAFDARVIYRTVGPYATINHDRVITVCGVQPEAWASTAFFEPYFTKTMTPDAALAAIEENQTKVISSFKPVFGYNVAADNSYSPLYGSTLGLRFPLYESILNVSIVDIMSVSEDPDSTTYFPGEPDKVDFIIMHLDLLHQMVNSTKVSKFYMKLGQGVNYTRVMDDVLESAPHSFTSIRSALEATDEILQSRASRSIHGIYTLNVLFSIIYLSIGVSIIASDKNNLYKKQFSVLRALGSEQRVIQGLMTIDMLMSIAIAAAIGIGVGLLISTMIAGTPLMYLGITITISWTRLPVSISLPTLLFALIILLSFIVPLVSTYIVTTRSTKKGIAEELQAAV
ncbi:ABC transporter permease [Candidatus Thorarchaeota archaeon]|nr:MAG: ABC transporter permease [Candidatus Thorarchaeota archaeon]